MPYIHQCINCGATRKADYRVNIYLCRQCKQLRDETNRKARNGSRRLKALLIEKYGDYCFECNQEIQGLILHHVIPVALGGKTEEDNVLLLCNTCHKELHKNEDSLQHKGYAILTGEG